MALTDEQEKALRAIFPDDADRLIDEAQAKTKELEERGVAFKEADADQEPEQEKPVDWDQLVREVATEVASRLDVDVTAPLAEMAEQVKALAGRVDRMAEADADREQVGETRYRLSLEKKRASEAEETVLDEDDELLKSKPKETEPETTKSGASHFFPVPK